jgi:hypothetical protein
MTIMTLRNASLNELATVLQEQHAARYDVVVPHTRLRFEGGNLIITGSEEPEITEHGVTPAAPEVCLTPTEIFDSGISDRLGIPLKYLRRMRDGEKSELLDHNVNTWLAESGKAWFIRGFRGDDETCGVARAFLSDRFGALDNFDMLIAALEGVKAAGVQADVVGADLSERRMQVRVVVPEVEALAPVLLRGYRSPIDDADPRRAAQAEAHGYLRPDDRPVVFAGFVIGNSETGGGAFTITPRIMVKVCRNGLVITKDAMRRTHLGSKMEEGQIEWSDETNRKLIELVTSQATDAVKQFCTQSYVEAKIAEMEEQAGAEVQPTEAADVVVQVCKTLAFSEEEAAGVLGHFIQGGQLTAGGVMQAVTSFAQTIADPDRANAVEEAGVPALAAAAQLVTV